MMYDVYRSAGKGGAEQGVGGGAGCGVILRSCEQRCKYGAYLVHSASIATENVKWSRRLMSAPVRVIRVLYSEYSE
jgi:hypothetical protein